MMHLKNANLTPINLAEAIFEPFWDPSLSGLEAWTIEPGEQHGLKVEQNWCWVSFEWADRPVDGPALVMQREFDVDCSGYDRLLFSLVPPPNTTIQVTVQTNLGNYAEEYFLETSEKQELCLDLHGAVKIHRIRLKIETNEGGVQSGWLNWIGLQKTSLLDPVLQQWAIEDTAWEGYLKPDNFEPNFKPFAGLLVNDEELVAIRARYVTAFGDINNSPIAQNAAEIAREARKISPERRVGDFVNFWGDTRYNRKRDDGRVLLGTTLGGFGVQAASAGLLLKDKELLRLAARFALSISRCEHWDDGMICRFPGSTWEHRCFVQSLCTFETALILDLAGELFTDLGREWIERRIAEEGLASIRYNTWKHEYIFHNNQLAWFSPGRMAGALLLEKTWPRARVEAELAYQDLVESLEYAILPDGGYVEGPTYFTTVAHFAGMALYLYAKARNKSFASVIPTSMQRTSDFAASVASTTPDTDVIPICDAGHLLDQNTLAVMASLLPNSAWNAMLQKSMARLNGLPETLFALSLTEKNLEVTYHQPSYIYLPEMGLMTSTRQLGNTQVKLLVMGNHAGAGHTHEDKGSFVLEFAGEIFAMDPGTCDYSHPLADMLKNCERHNMLVPYGTPERPAPPIPLMVDLKPIGNGDDLSFNAWIDASQGWEDYYLHWKRQWASTSPDELTITDKYELLSGEGVEFYWNTRLPVTIGNESITISGVRGTIHLIIPQDCSVRVDELPMLTGKPQQRIAFRKPGRSGTLIIQAKLTLN